MDVILVTSLLIFDHDHDNHDDELFLQNDWSMKGIKLYFKPGSEQDLYLGRTWVQAKVFLGSCFPLLMLNKSKKNKPGATVWTTSLN